MDELHDNEIVYGLTRPVLSYNSCRDRHRPKFLTAARNAWVVAREAELLPVGHVHIVFTMPVADESLTLRACSPRRFSASLAAINCADARWSD